MSPREALQTALGLLLLTFYLLQITYERFGELGGKSWCLVISTEILEAGLPRKQTWCVVTAYSKVLCI